MVAYYSNLNLHSEHCPSDTPIISPAPKRATSMSERKPQPAGQSKEYQEQLAIEAIARSRYPDARIKEIQPGFNTDKHNYVWLVILDTNKPFENTLTTVDSNDIRLWQQQQKRKPKQRRRPNNG